MDAAALFATGFGTGLLAGGTTCAAVQLGLLTGAVRGEARTVRPVAVFLSAKLVTHAALGALLGLAGAAVEPSPRIRAVLLVGAAALMVLFALDLVGFGPVRRLLRRSPKGGEGGRAAGGGDGDGAGGGDGDGDGGGRDAHCAPSPVSRTGRTRRPAALGAATVLVPCALTLTAELLAVSSRSPFAGAAVMAGFVLGTAPLFGLVGVTVGRALTLLRGRLTAVVAVALLAVAGWTLLSGLRLGGWLPDGGSEATAAASARFVTTDASGTQLITIYALDQGYRPAALTARAGVRTVLVLRTDNTHGHTRAFTIPARGRDVVLPVTGETRVDLGVPGPGRLRYVCASGHSPGEITFR
ncbi:sulfite exporter TauE/SafE family protein [Actinomadura logoneensis]|uniref:Sulfite exporter TauE/SafE family protein n=1 Tax=Actinomadura logoneensis TaxID=2293572 RepID=A0A372JC16_9ACTN|nr:sulfite exporter TauE/SafE family protein [Actinomadura logoneensis]RFU37510.1 sulfite exporter TauE/SafE family protein [Actinomadura logoneensis]